MKNLFLIAFAAVAFMVGPNVVDACCGGCDGKTTVKADEKKTEKTVTDAKDGECCGEKAAEVKADTKDGACCGGCDSKTDAVVSSSGDVVVEVKATEVNEEGAANTKRAATGQLVKADLVATSSASKAGGCCGGCGSGCGATAEKPAKTEKVSN